ncbi:hypothetical protein HZS_2928, partial [Henneguya salminicola]
MNWTNSENIVWFIQVSDLHLNVFGPHDRHQEFKDFCSSYINTLIRPRAVFITGDILDSKVNFFKSTGLIPEECRLYHNILSETNVSWHTVWRDIRGNHDASQVSDADDLCYTMGRPSGLNKLGHSFETVIQTNFGQYNFIGLDLCPSPGLLLPMNFFGEINTRTRHWATNKKEKTKKYNHTIWLTHYPISFLKNGEQTFFLRELFSFGIASMFGHLHVNKKLYARDPLHGNFLLELGDWRNNRRFRLFAFDNDLFSFKDFNYKKDNVIILITNPKNFEFLSPPHEPTGRIILSTHIRALIFSTIKIIKIIVMINNQHHCSLSPPTESLNASYRNNVFTCSWDPNRLNHLGPHNIRVI